MFNLFVKKNSEYNCPEVVNTLPENESSIEVLIDTINTSDIQPLSDWFYTITDKDYILFDENSLLTNKKDKKLQIVAVKCYKYNSDSCTLHCDNSKLIHVESADGKVSSEFHALFFLDKGNLNYKVLEYGNDSNVMNVVREHEADYVVSVKSNVFGFEVVEKLDNLDRFMLNNRYCECLTNSETISLLSTDNDSEKLHGKTVILNTVVGYGDFDENSYNISEYLMNEFRTL